MSGILFIISAPSGSGKTTLTNEILKLVPNLRFSVSYTTRPPRGSEINGRDYFFVSKSEFEKMLGENAFLEHACVFGHFYGTARRFLEEAKQAGQDLLLDIDVQGAAQLKRREPEALSIFILPPSRQALENRLRNRRQAEKEAEKQVGRSGENLNYEEIIRRRLDGARKEIEKYPEYDYILVNDRLEQSIDDLKAIVAAERIRRSEAVPSPGDSEVLARAQRCRRENVSPRAQQILASFAEPAAPRKE
jgi:guanylate kinase